LAASTEKEDCDTDNDRKAKIDAAYAPSEARGAAGTAAGSQPAADSFGNLDETGPQHRKRARAGHAGH
jgi:hypothetical protein